MIGEEAMESTDFRSATAADIVSTLLRSGSVLLRNFVDTAALTRVHEMVLLAYQRFERKHLHPAHLRELGLPAYSDLLFTEQHYDLLDKTFGRRSYEISDDTASRRMRLARKPPYWGMPLAPHVDAFFHSPWFTVNFWIPFQECGVDAPSLAVIESPFADVLAFTGYQDGAEIWADPEPVGHLTRFRPEMKAMCADCDPALIASVRERFHDHIHIPSFAPGDAMMLTNWTLHFTHTTPSMTKARDNLELRFRSSNSLDEILGEHGV
jgi:hypothetical protein